MTFVQQYGDYILQEYQEKKRSIGDISKELGASQSTIRRSLLTLGVKMRTRAEAQKLALESGRASHPTKGKERTEEEKRNISEGVAKDWATIDDKTRAERRQMQKDKWASMSEMEKENLRHAAAQSRHNTTYIGSKMERYLAEQLEKLGYFVHLHTKVWIGETNLELDLFLPGEKIVIEIDGPQHFYPIHGHEGLNRQIAADNKKNGLILFDGYVIIRAKHTVKNLSQKYMRDLSAAIIEEVEKVVTNFPTDEADRYIRVDIEGDTSDLYQNESSGS